MQVPIIPSVGETVILDGDFRRCGSFVVERVATSLVCNGRRNGWVQDDLLDVYINVYVREKDLTP